MRTRLAAWLLSWFATGVTARLCPFHEERTPSMLVYSHDGLNLYHCLGCGREGRAEDLPNG
jgi:hypothetical protein